MKADKAPIVAGGDGSREQQVCACVCLRGSCRKVSAATGGQ